MIASVSFQVLILYPHQGILQYRYHSGSVPDQDPGFDKADWKDYRPFLSPSFHQTFSLVLYWSGGSLSPLSFQFFNRYLLIHSFRYISFILLRYLSRWLFYLSYPVWSFLPLAPALAALSSPLGPPPLLEHFITFICRLSLSAFTLSLVGSLSFHL